MPSTLSRGRRCPSPTALALLESSLPPPWAASSARASHHLRPDAGADSHGHGQGAGTPLRALPRSPHRSPHVFGTPPARRRLTLPGWASMTVSPARPASRLPPAGSVRQAPLSTPRTSSTPRTGRISAVRGSFRTGRAARSRWSGASRCCRAGAPATQCATNVSDYDQVASGGADSYYKTLAKNLMSAASAPLTSGSAGNSTAP